MSRETSIIKNDLQDAGFKVSAWGRKALVKLVSRRVTISEIRTALEQLGYDECQYQLRRNPSGLGVEVEAVL